jgi:hypothetical protein
MADVPIEQMLEQIQRHLDARQGALAGSAAASSHGDRFSEMVYDSLEEAGVVIDSIQIQPALTPPHLPLIGDVWQKVRWQAHALVVFYVNRLAGTQGVFNRAIMGALTVLVSDLDRGGRANLEAEIAELRAELQALRAEVDARMASAPERGS